MALPFGKKTLPRNKDRSIPKSRPRLVTWPNLLKEILIHRPRRWLMVKTWLGETLRCVILTFSKGVIDNRTILFPPTWSAVDNPAPPFLLIPRPKVIPFAI